MEPIVVGERIAARRKELGFTQKDVADHLHISVAAVSKWERGLNFPDMSLLEPLASLLAMTVPTLLGLEEHSTEQAVRDVTALAATQQRSADVLRRRGIAVGVAGGLFGVLAFLIMQLLREGALLSDRGMTVLEGGFPVYLALGLGVCSWLSACIALLWKDSGWRRWCSVSLLTCAGALYTTIFIMDIYVRAEQIDTLMDTSVGFHIAAAVLLLGTVIFNVCVWVIHRKN